MKKVKISYVILWGLLLIISMVLAFTLPAVWVYYNGFQGISLQDLGMSNEVVQKLVSGISLIDGILPKSLGVGNIAKLTLSYMTAYVPADFPENNLPVKFWASIIFIALIYIQNLIVVLFTLKKIKKNDDAMFNIPIIVQSILCLIVSVIIALFMVINDNIYYVMAIVIYVILIIVSFVLLLGTDLLKSHIEGIEKEAKQNRKFMDDLQSDTEILIENIEHKDSKEKAKKLLEEIKYSDSISSESLIDIENEIKEKFDSINSIIKKNSSTNITENIDNLLSSLKIRNNLCKKNK